MSILEENNSRHPYNNPNYFCILLGCFNSSCFDLFSEFSKRMDPELPFFCHTLNERFSTDLLPSFDEVPIGCNDNGGDNDDDTDSRNPYRLHRLVRNTREDSSIFAAGRSSLPARNRVSTRQRFHRFDIGLPHFCNKSSVLNKATCKFNIVW